MAQEGPQPDARTRRTGILHLRRSRVVETVARISTCSSWQAAACSCRHRHRPSACARRRCLRMPSCRRAWLLPRAPTARNMRQHAVRTTPKEHKTSATHIPVFALLLFVLLVKVARVSIAVVHAFLFRRFLRLVRVGEQQTDRLAEAGSAHLFFLAAACFPIRGHIACGDDSRQHKNGLAARMQGSPSDSSSSSSSSSLFSRSRKSQPPSSTNFRGSSCVRMHA
jgi:hypothetical protein